MRLINVRQARSISIVGSMRCSLTMRCSSDSYKQLYIASKDGRVIHGRMALLFMIMARMSMKNFILRFDR